MRVLHVIAVGAALAPSAPEMINIWRDPDAAAFVRSVADGNEAVPAVVINGRAIVNPAPRVVNPDRVLGV